MNMKKAIKKATKHNHKWIADDIYSEIYSYIKKPKYFKCGYWANDKSDEQFIGLYTGQKKPAAFLKKINKLSVKQ